jgi:uncharacterized membrane protein HdeD (DUF308 family)
MENLLRNTFVQAILTLIMGIGLVNYADLAPSFMVQALGLLFIIPGLVTAIGAFAVRGKTALMLPSVVGTGSVIFGVILLIFPSLFISILMYLLSILLIIAGVLQMLKWINISKKGMNVHWIFFLFPIATLITGVFILSNPLSVASLPFQIIGYAAIVYALIEIIIAIRSYFFLRTLKKEEANMQLEQLADNEQQ